MPKIGFIVVYSMVLYGFLMVVKAISQDRMNNILETSKPIDSYLLVGYSLKYGGFLIALALLMMLLFDLLGKKKAVLVQYGVAGVCLAMFHLLLLAVSEYFGFKEAYVIAAAAVAIPMGLYIGAITEKGKLSFLTTLILAGFYGLMYALLQMKNIALLASTVLIMCVVYLMMFLTKGLHEEEPEESDGEIKNKKVLVKKMGSEKYQEDLLIKKENEDILKENEKILEENEKILKEIEKKLKDVDSTTIDEIDGNINKGGKTE